MNKPTREEVSALLSEIKYKPGASICLRPLGLYYDASDLVIEFNLPIILLGSDEPNHLRGYEPLLFKSDEPWEKTVLKTVRTLIHRMEEHEADEQLTVSGHRVFDPHYGEVNLYSFSWTDRKKTPPMDVFLSKRGQKPKKEPVWKEEQVRVRETNPYWQEALSKKHRFFHNFHGV